MEEPSRTRLLLGWIDRRRRPIVTTTLVAFVLVGAVVVVNVLPEASVSTEPPSTPPPIATASTVAMATPTDTPTPEPVTAPPTPSPTVPNGGYADLDGVAVAPELGHRLPLAVMIDDNAHARPQAGMNAASIVYQAPVDGGEVRYMVVFQEGDSKSVGPVRSARPHFVQWASEYRALLGHYGGDHVSRTQVIPRLSSSIYNMDALAGGSCPYHRVTTNIAPYNAFTDTATLRRCADKKGYPPSVAAGLATRTFEDAPRPSPGAAATIAVHYRKQTVGYAFDAASSGYLRSVDGKPEIDAADGRQVTARNVVVLFQSLANDPNQEPGYNRPVVGNIGSGEALVFRNGTVTQGVWKKASETDLTRVTDPSGAEIPLVRGRIFIQVVAIGTQVTYS